MNILITGGAGFIGVHTANYYLSKGNSITVFDNFSRKGTRENVKWLEKQYGSKNIKVIKGDIRDFDKLKQSVPGHDVIIHLAGQVAVTTSVVNPREDFEINALGTFNVLESVRLLTPDSIFLFASTNKVYGGMEEIKIIKKGRKYIYRDLPGGISEAQNLDFHSPYGNSKGVADQYVRDYHRIYGLRTVVFRQSCLAADQDIITPFGKKRIDQIRVGDLVHSGHGWTRVKRVWKTGIKAIRKITTMNGISVSLTKDHRITRPDGLRMNKDLMYGDFLAVLPEAEFTPEFEPLSEQLLQPDKYIDTVKSYSDNSRCMQEAKRIVSKLLPLNGEKLLAITEIVGRLFGDGHLGIHHRQSRITPSYTVQHFGSEAELVELRERLAWLEIPAGNIIQWKTISSLSAKHTIQGISRRIQQQSVAIFTLFEQLGVPVGDKVRVNYGLPRWVVNGHSLVKRAFLRGFFGAELTKVNANSYIAPSFAQSKDVTCLNNGRRFIKQLCRLLADFGIKTSVFEATPVTFKRGKTIQITVRLLGGDSLFPKLAKIGYAFSNERSHHLNALLRWRWENTSPKRSKEISVRFDAGSQLFWDSVSTIENKGKSPVYDLEVEDTQHLFIAGGIQVSNCIYGTHQFGIEDQGWVSWFTIASVLGKPIIVYGDGMQVRDVLFVEDLVRAYDASVTDIGKAAGKIYNVGGGPKFTLSLLELLALLEKKLGKKIPYTSADWRPGDQPVYVSNISKINKELGWEPQISVTLGTSRMIDWIVKEKELIKKVLG